MSENSNDLLDNDKPLKKIPTITGFPFFSPIKDRIDFFYSQGQYKYFESRVAKHNSTVLRMNMIPGPFAADPRIVALCDAVSFRVLFDPSKVEKKNSLTGNYMPSLGFTGGYRVCAYLDPSEDTHTKIKQVFFNAQAARKSTFIPTFLACYDALFDKMEAELDSNKKSGFTKLNEVAAFDFINQTLVGPKPSDDVRSAALKFVFFQFHPIMTVGLPKLVEELVLHTFPYPTSTAKSAYRTLYDYYSPAGSWILDDAEKVGLARDEAIHHLIFTWVVNAYLGTRTYLMRLFKWVVAAGPDLHDKLAREVRTVVRSENGEITFTGLEQMELTKSVAYEAFRIDPPVQVQYGTARADMVIESHDAKFEVNKGEMLCGFQPMATRDPRIFERPTEFVAERFMGEGKKMLKHVLWANGPETESSRVDNKICVGKEMGVLVGRLLLAVMFRRYDKVAGEVGTTMEDLDVTVTELTKAAAAGCDVPEVRQGRRRSGDHHGRPGCYGDGADQGGCCWKWTVLSVEIMHMFVCL